MSEVPSVTPEAHTPKSKAEIASQIGRITGKLMGRLDRIEAAHGKDAYRPVDTTAYYSGSAGKHEETPRRYLGVHNINMQEYVVDQDKKGVKLERSAINMSSARGPGVKRGERVMINANTSGNVGLVAGYDMTVADDDGGLIGSHADLTNDQTIRAAARILGEARNDVAKFEIAQKSAHSLEESLNTTAIDRTPAAEQIQQNVDNFVSATPSSGK